MKNLKNKKIKTRKTETKGALLLELLIAISLLAIILSVSANAVFLSIRSNKISGARDVGNALASESMEAARSVTEEDWQNIYGLIKSTQHYYPAQSSGKWILTMGDETVNTNNTVYTRYLIVDNVSRDSSTQNIQTSYSGTDDDPSTQKVTVTVTWSGGNPITISGYFFRWENKICAQGGWTTGGSGNTVKLCSDTNYDTKDAVIDVVGGSLKVH